MPNFCAFARKLSIAVFLILLNNGEQGHVTAQRDLKSELPPTPPRTFARRGIDGSGGTISFRSPGPFAVVPTGEVAIEVVATGLREAREVVLYVDNRFDQVLQLNTTSGDARIRVYSGAISVNAGSVILHAVMISKESPRAVATAYGELMARPRDHDTVSSSRAVCAGDQDSTIRTATSQCDALLQLAHEELVSGNPEKASSLITEVVVLSAAAGREGDRAHAEHVYPYLQLALAATKMGDQASGRRAMQTVHRLQPGYLLPSKPHSADLAAGKAFSISTEGVQAVDLEPVWHLVCEWTARELVGPAGMLAEGGAVGNPGGHYRLLSHIASQLRDALIIEMGSMHGASALSLALGHPSNRVVTYNIVDDFSKNAAACGLSGHDYMAAVHTANLRVEWRLEDIMASDERMSELLQASLIHIDINHHGDIEDAILQFLVGNDYRGLVLLDDIYLNQAMDAVWAGLGGSLCKYDLTDLGHTVAGSGLVDFSCCSMTGRFAPIGFTFMMRIKAAGTLPAMALQQALG